MNLAEFFINGSCLTSHAGVLVYNLVNRLSRQFRDIPQEYIALLSDIAKYSSISGLLQPTGPEALHRLEVTVEGN